MNEEDVNTLSEQHENKKTKTKAPYDLQKEFLESCSVGAEHSSKFRSERRLKIEVSDDSSQSQ